MIGAGFGSIKTSLPDLLEPPTVAVREGAVLMTFRLPASVAEGMAATREPRRKPGTLGNTLGKAPGKTLGKTPAALLQLLQEEPGLAIPGVAARLGKSESAIERAIRRLRESGRLTREGPAKGGTWKVIA